MAKVKNKEQAIGSQNRTVTPNEAKSALEHCIRLQRPIMTVSYTHLTLPTKRIV